MFCHTLTHTACAREHHHWQDSQQQQYIFDARQGAPGDAAGGVGAVGQAGQGLHVDVGHQHGHDVLLGAGAQDVGGRLQGEGGGVLGVKGDAAGNQGGPVYVDQGTGAGAADGGRVAACVQVQDSNSERQDSWPRRRPTAKARTGHTHMRSTLLKSPAPAALV